MSADADFTMTTPALLKAAEKYQACATFQIIEGGSRHRCTECDGTEAAHIIVALRTALDALPRDNTTPCAECGHSLVSHACEWHLRAGSCNMAPCACQIYVSPTVEHDPPLPGEGENDWDEEHRRKPRMTSAERQQGMVDEGHEDWLEGRDDR